MDEFVVLCHKPVSLSSPEARAFISDACRAGENCGLTDQELAEIYKLTPQELETLANNPAVGDAIRRERAARVRSGQAAREMAAQSFIKAPKILDEIMSDKATHPKFRIESARELKATAFAEDKQAPVNSAEKFIIRIDLTAGGGGDVETYEVPVMKQFPSANKDASGDDWGWSER
jgi:hypothetical protein